MARKAGTMRKDGRYEVQKVIGHTIDGKPIRKSFYGKTKGEANAKYDKWVEQQARGETLTRTTSLSDWAIKWAEIYKEPNVSSATYKTTYLYAIESYIIPYFRSTKISDIRKSDIQKFFRDNKNKSSAVLKKVKLVLNQIFEDAIDDGLCHINPCRGVKLGKEKRVVEKQVYSSKEVAKILDYAKTHKYGIDIAILLNTGVRRGELLGLRWEDFDFKECILKIERAVKANGTLGDPKSEAGKREIPFDKYLKEFLLPMRSIGFVIKNSTGGFMQPNNWDHRRYKQFMDSASAELSIPRLSAHELRHTYGTLLRERGVDIYTIQKVMGHSDIRVTADRYVHNDIDTLKKALGL